MMKNNNELKMDAPTGLNLNKETSNSTVEKKSFRVRSKVINQDQIKLIKSFSQFSNLANYDYDLKRAESNSSIKVEPKVGLNTPELNRNNDINIKMFNGVGQNDVYGDMKHDVLSIENNDDLIHDYDRWKNWPHASKCLSNVSRDNDIGYINGRFDHSKRGSLISNLSAFFYRNDPKEDQ